MFSLQDRFYNSSVIWSTSHFCLALLSTLEKYTGFYFPPRKSFLLFHQVCFPSRLLFPHRLSNATQSTGCTELLAMRSMEDQKERGTRVVDIVEADAERQLLHGRGMYTAKKKPSHLRFGPLKHVILQTIICNSIASLSS